MEDVGQETFQVSYTLQNSDLLANIRKVSMVLWTDRKERLLF